MKKLIAIMFILGSMSSFAASLGVSGNASNLLRTGSGHDMGLSFQFEMEDEWSVVLSSANIGTENIQAQAIDSLDLANIALHILLDKTGGEVLVSATSAVETGAGLEDGFCEINELNIIPGVICSESPDEANNIRMAYDMDFIYTSKGAVVVDVLAKYEALTSDELHVVRLHRDTAEIGEAKLAADDQDLKGFVAYTSILDANKMDGSMGEADVTIDSSLFIDFPFKGPAIKSAMGGTVKFVIAVTQL